MPRTLPWLKKGSAAGKSSPAKPSASVRGGTRPPTYPYGSRKHPASPDTDNGIDTKHNASSAGTSQRRARLQAPTSPPSSPPPEPPQQEPMREGWAADDSWMMVEDEFLSTAHLFTAHLHRAEYKRLTALAAERAKAAGEQAVLRSVHEPVPRFAGKTSKKRSIPVATEDDSGDKGLWVGDPMLADLMDSPRKAPPVLKRSAARRGSSPGPQTIQSATAHHELSTNSQPRVQSGSGNQQEAAGKKDSDVNPSYRALADKEEDEDEYEDDLDGPVAARPFRITKQAIIVQDRTPPAPRFAKKTPWEDVNDVQSPRASFSEKPPKTERNRQHRQRAQQPQLQPSRPRQHTKSSAIPEIIISSNERMAQILAERRARQEAKGRKEKSDRNDETMIEIPTFTI